MVTKRKSRLLASFVVVFATASFLATDAISATPDPAAAQPQVEATAPPATPEAKTVPASEQKNADEPSKNGKSDKKRGPMSGMLLTIFAIITGHQGTTR